MFLMQQSQAVSENIVYLTHVRYPSHGAADYPNFKGYIMVWVLSACFGSFLEFPYSQQMIFFLRITRKPEVSLSATQSRRSQDAIPPGCCPACFSTNSVSRSQLQMFPRPCLLLYVVLVSGAGSTVLQSIQSQFYPPPGIPPSAAT